MSDPPALRLRGVEKRYGTTAALRGVDLDVAPGELLGLLGPNGAGKSTLVKLACGLMRPTAGTAEVGGDPSHSLAARARVGYLAELFQFPAWLTAEQVLRHQQRLAGSRGGEAERTRVLDLAGITEHRGRRVGALSKGMQQRLGIAQALLGDPRLVLLDEPTSALDPLGRRAVRALLETLRDRGVAVVVNSHLLTEVEHVCDRVAILDHGRIVRTARTADLLRPRGVRVTTGRGLVDHPGATAADVPGIVRALVAAGEDVHDAREDVPTMEELYVETLREARGA